MLLPWFMLQAVNEPGYFMLRSPKETIDEEFRQLTTEGI